MSLMGGCIHTHKHGPKLEAHESPPQITNPFLFEQDRTGRTTRINTATTAINGTSSGRASRITPMSRIRFQRKTRPGSARKASRDR